VGFAFLTVAAAIFLGFALGYAFGVSSTRKYHREIIDNLAKRLEGAPQAACYFQKWTEGMKSVADRELQSEERRALGIKPKKDPNHP